MEKLTSALGNPLLHVRPLPSGRFWAPFDETCHLIPLYPVYSPEISRSIVYRVMAANWNAMRG